MRNTLARKASIASVTANNSNAPTAQNGLISLLVALTNATGNVDEAPLIWVEMMVLSRHSVNDSRPPAMSADEMSGRVIWRNARRGGAPRSPAASSSDSSIPARRARTMRVTTALAYSDCPTHRRSISNGTKPRKSLSNGPPIRLNQPARAMASMISGVTRMRNNSAIITLLQAPGWRARATPHRPPSTTAITVAPKAAMKDPRMLSPTPAFMKIDRYHSVVTPLTMMATRKATGNDHFDRSRLRLPRTAATRRGSTMPMAMIPANHSSIGPISLNSNRPVIG